MCKYLCFFYFYMTSTELEVTITENTSIIFSQPFECIDSNELIYLAFTSTCPRIQQLFYAFIKTHFLNQVQIVVVDLSIKLTENSGIIYEYKWINLQGKKSYIYGALLGSAQTAFDEIRELLKNRYT